jgi:CRISPR system Cascade subunit CasE
MSVTLHLTRVRLKPSADVRALAHLLVPDEEGARIAANHQLAWSLFAGDPNRKRDFLWREEEPGRLILLSSEPPVGQPAVLEIERSRRFARLPRGGERFVFALRANPTVSLPQRGTKANGKRRGGKPVDVIMRALHDIPSRRGPDGRMRAPLEPGRGRPFARDALLGWVEGEGADPRRPALDWLARQGERKGFALDREATRVMAYRRVALPRHGRGGEAKVVFGQVDFEGALTVTDEAAFHAALRDGIGRAKAFGCGLMLIAPAPMPG